MLWVILTVGSKHVWLNKNKFLVWLNWYQSKQHLLNLSIGLFLKNMLDYDNELNKIILVPTLAILYIPYAEIDGD